MKIKFIITALALLLSFKLYADPEGEPNTNPPSSENGIVINPSLPPITRPESLDPNEVIICHITNNGLEFILPSGVESASVNIFNETQGWIDFITHDNNIIEHSLSTGVYTIECYTNDGRVFIGSLAVD